MEEPKIKKKVWLVCMYFFLHKKAWEKKKKKVFRKKNTGEIWTNNLVLEINETTIGDMSNYVAGGSV